MVPMQLDASQVMGDVRVSLGADRHFCLVDIYIVHLLMS